MSLEDQIRRRDAMLESVESVDHDEWLGDVVRRLHHDEGVELDVLHQDLEQIKPLLSDEDHDTVDDVFDLIIGSCRPEQRIGPYAWGDPRNVFWRRHQAGKPYAGPDWD